MTSSYSVTGGAMGRVQQDEPKRRKSCGVQFWTQELMVQNLGSLGESWLMGGNAVMWV